MLRGIRVLGVREFAEMARMYDCDSRCSVFVLHVHCTHCVLFVPILLTSIQFIRMYLFQCYNNIILFLEVVAEPQRYQTP